LALFKKGTEQEIPRSISHARTSCPASPVSGIGRVWLAIIIGILVRAVPLALMSWSGGGRGLFYELGGAFF
jgi:hypothetical protein